jgi:prepilin-type N-terminal cleavage/methylation domain-containing protein
MFRISHCNRRGGFTLVELLVVIAIIGTLVGLLLPAVQQARESARRTKCSNQIKEMSTAVLNYESVNKRLPHGAIDWSRTGSGDSYLAGWSWLYFILPFMEETALYQAGAVQSGESLEAEGGFPQRGYRLVNKGPEWLRCPSDSDVAPASGVSQANTKSATNYAASGGPKRHPQPSVVACPWPNGYEGYVAPWSSDSWEAWNMASSRAGLKGMFVGFNATADGNLEKTMYVRLKDIRDGQSKTIMLGELSVTNTRKIAAEAACTTPSRRFSRIRRPRRPRSITGCILPAARTVSGTWGSVSSRGMSKARTSRLVTVRCALSTRAST